ncbi:MAG TPA: ElyC/SanA/YdcF family protein [Steroidobacteraceae bacterium]|nr:ElyC/SanA/YdcF family protein [Steroidobacteraceae bacterium]
MSSLGNLLLPSHLALLLLVAGLLARFWHRTRGWSWRLIATGGAVALIFACGPVARALLSPLEQHYPAWAPGVNPALSIERIVLLTAWAGDNPGLPAGVRLNDSSASRAIVTVQLWRLHPDATVIVSGDARNARDLGDVLLSLGLPADRLVLESQSRNTADSANRVVQLLAGRPFALVTSAAHLPRSMATFAKAGLRPIPVPADYRLPGRMSIASFIPAPRALQASDLAVHEYLGLVWYRMLGRL